MHVVDLEGDRYVEDAEHGYTTIETSEGAYVVDTDVLDSLRKWAVVVGWRLGQVRRIDDD